MKKLTKSKKYTQGIYLCINKEKYKGSYPIIFRSSLEKKFMRWLDFNSNVITWKSESVIIPYLGPDNRFHRYFVDFSCEMKRKNGEIQKFLIEIKPQNQTIPPTVTPKKSRKTILYESYNFAVNTAKWEAAKQWSDKKGMKFIILTEKHLNS